MTPDRLIDEAIETDIDTWIESKQRDAEQLELIEEEDA